ncbi:MAG: hypothetical protein M1132_10270 [Chloroflexi bacterium]|nr:hypothetical protein [Chloroflexota bacterium]MCL5952084.1 hypothetical protein [Chloroflexota bacterium]
MVRRTALIVIGTYKEAWWGLSPVAQSDFIARVGVIAKEAGLTPEMGYRLPATPGAFLEVWEGADRAAVDRAVQELQAMGYSRYVDARWLIGEREIQTQTARMPRVRKKIER